MTSKLAALAVVLLSACTPLQPAKSDAAGAVPADLVLRSYSVPNGGAKEVRQLLETLLWFGAEGKDAPHIIGRADVGPNGDLVVMAAPSVQAGVQELIDSIAKSPAKPAPTMTFEYWFVLSSPGKEAPAANLAEVASALAEIVKSDGPEQFTLSEKLTVTSASGEVAEVDSHYSHIHQVMTAGPNDVRANINLDRNHQNLRTTLNLTPGQIVVLGSSGETEEGKTDAKGSLYFLIRAITHDGSGR